MSEVRRASNGDDTALAPLTQYVGSHLSYLFVNIIIYLKPNTLSYLCITI